MDDEVLIYPTTGIKGFANVVNQQNARLRYISLDKLCLGAGSGHEGAIGMEEALLVVLSGTCSVSLRMRESRDEGGSRTISWRDIGRRPNPFSGNPTAVYVPQDWIYEVEADRPAEILLVRSPWPDEGEGVRSEEKKPSKSAANRGVPAPFLIRPEDVKVVSAGVANWRRDVRFLLDASSPSRRLMAAETLNPTGNWSGFPPHKHDTVSDNETILEEVYHFAVNPPDSYGIQRVYDYGSTDRALVVHDGDVVVFRAGYHPTVAPPGTTLCYFWAVAGEEKAFKVNVDPHYAWLARAEGVVKEMLRGCGRQA